MLKFLLIILCVYFFVRILFKALAMNMRSYSSFNNQRSKAQTKRRGSADDRNVVIEDAKDDGGADEYTDYEEVK